MSDDTWRDLALQFDSHRMRAMSLLRAVRDTGLQNRTEIEKFLVEPPLSGKKILDERVREIAAARIHELEAELAALREARGAGSLGRELAYQNYINEPTANGNTRLDNILGCIAPCPEKVERHVATQIDRAFQAGWQAALAALEPAPVTPAEAWQPIETAPKDGTFVIVLLGNGEVFRAQHIDSNWLAGSDIGWVSAVKWMPYRALADAGEAG